MTIVDASLPPKSDSSLISDYSGGLDRTIRSIIYL